MAVTSQLRVLTIEIDRFEDSTLYRLEKGWTLHIELGHTLADKDVRLYVNHPVNSSDGADRERYRQLQWKSYSDNAVDMFDKYAPIPLVLAGSFNYYFTIGDNPEHRGRGTFLVDPALHVGPLDEKLHLDAVCCQTVLTKSLGKFEDWESRLSVAKESGYNMIHFTPIQELGGSNSSYCIADQHSVNSAFYNSPDKPVQLSDVEKLVRHMQKDWGVLSLVDLVFNHTANESPWIQEHPECVYNVINTPHLKPAYVLDRALYHFNNEIAAGKWTAQGIPPEIGTEDVLKTIHWHLSNTVLPKCRIEEFYIMNIDDIVQQFATAIAGGYRGSNRSDKLSIINDPKYRRLKATIDMQTALYLYNTERTGLSEDQRIGECCATLRSVLEQLNHERTNEICDHLNAACGNILANAHYRFLDPAGPKIPRVTEKEPIMFYYFMPRAPKDIHSLAKEEELMHTEAWGSFCMAHNGWVMGDDPLRNFAEPGSNVYLRRELIPWGDSVKLRYGSCPEDVPFLWEHMKRYTVDAARVFHGIRLDNCHSTPIHVAEYMLHEARKVRPDLYIIAELFTSSEQKDNIFINRLGLTSLIREGLNPGSAHQLGDLVHRYGGLPVGAFIQPEARPIMPSVANALFMDQTHDNPSPVEKRSVFDLLPSAALIAMSCCATGSNRGYDELVPHHINVVKEKRFYRGWSTSTKANSSHIHEKTGIIAAKHALNKLHQELIAKGFTQIYVDRVDDDIVSVTRHNPISHQSVVLVSRTAFKQPSDNNETGCLPPLVVPGDVDEIILEARLVTRNKGPATKHYTRNAQYINGVEGYNLVMQQHIKMNDSEMVELKEMTHNDIQEVQFVNFPRGSVIAFRVNLKTPIKMAVLNLRKYLSLFGFRMHTYSGRNLKQMTTNELELIVTKLNLNDINRVLFRCDAEEKDDGKNGGVYDIPGYGRLNFCGLHGILSVLNRLRPSNDLGHHLCDNLRNGDWMLQYITSRLLQYPNTKPLGQWLEKVFRDLSSIPRYLIPCYFDAIIRGVYQIVEEVACAKMSPLIRHGSTLTRALAMCSVQFCSEESDSRHLGLLANRYKRANVTGLVTMAAGLPHFAAGIWRNWGRDTFIALPGLLLVTGRYSEARWLILGYAATLRHGLIPNLLGEGACARYNCRDAVWWWLYSIKLYCNTATDGHHILQDDVARLYPHDHTDPPQVKGETIQPLHAVIQEALQRHADGMKFRERNAGDKLDSEMCDEGFNVEFGVDWKTGFVYGGSERNCGTWMDKMGSSYSAGNKGKPATPRDGSAVELVGLCKAVVTWLSEISQDGRYPYSGVNLTDSSGTREMSYQAWSSLIEENFQRYFWVSDPPSPYERRTDLVNRRCIYKDTVNASQPWTDYQLRCNFPIAIVVAPELFSSHPQRAKQALDLAGEVLMGPLGMKTLDPSDYNYRGDYINSDDSNDFHTARGFNYHQGPEWLWPVGYYLRARLLVARMLDAHLPDATFTSMTGSNVSGATADSKVGGVAMGSSVNEALNYVHRVLCRHNSHIQRSEWNSLPELTNSNGKVCPDSCAAQAWSVGCVLEVLEEIRTICDSMRRC